MTAVAGGPGFDAVVLAGGRASRVGGVDKPGLVVGDRTLIASVSAAAVGAGARRVIVVGPDRPGLTEEGPRPPGGWSFVREDPPGAGPVPALLCGLAQVSAPVVAALAGDLPFLRSSHLRPLLDAVSAGAAGAVMLDASGRPQWLAGCWRVAALRDAAPRYGGRSLHGLLTPLAPAVISYHLAPGEPPPWLDCDTAEDLALARRWRESERER